MLRLLFDLELTDQFFVRCLKRLRHRAGFGDRGHKIHVADPAGKYVHVKVRSDAGTGGLADIQAHVKTLRRVNIAECRLALFCQVHHLVRRLLIGFIEVGDVLVRHDHQMTGPVRINIQDHKIKPGTLEDEFFLVACRAI